MERRCRAGIVLKHRLRDAQVVGFAGLHESSLSRGRIAQVLSFACLVVMCAVEPAGAEVPANCLARLLVKLTPDVPNSRAPSFLDSLAADPLFKLYWVRTTQGSVVLELTGPAPQYRCQTEIRRIRRDGRVVWLRVLHGR